MKIKVLIIILLSFFKFSIFPFVTLIQHMDIFHQSFLRNCLKEDFEIFDNFVFSMKVLIPLMATAGDM